MKLPLRLFAALAVAVPMCVAQALTPSGAAAEAPAAKPSPVAVRTADTSAKSYVIGPLDVLDIHIWNDAKLSGAFAVRPDGILSMPLIGEIQADGMTIPELTRTIATKLTAVMNDPEVNIQLGRINSKKYYVYGEVLKQGEFPLIGDMTVLDAFASTGGFKDFANRKKIYVLRGNEKLKFNYNDVSKGKRMDQNFVLKNGDKIFVPE